MALGWLLVILWLTGIFGRGIPRTAAEAVPSADVIVYAEVKSMSSLYAWAVHIHSSKPLHEISGGGAVALAFSVQIPAGWEVREVSCATGAAGMNLTRSQNGAELTCLLDGYPPQGDGEGKLIRMVLIAEGSEAGQTAEGPPTICLTADEREGFYYMDAHGKIFRAEMELVSPPPEFTTSGSDDIFESEPETEFCTAEGDGASTEIETGGAGKDPALMPPAVPAVPAVFVGCQETPVRDGAYAVRFLFRGESGGSPVVCVGGVGAPAVLTMEIQTASRIEEYRENQKIPVRHEGDWQICVFRGLSRKGSYEFLVYTQEKILRVQYRDGEFVGMEEEG